MFPNIINKVNPKKLCPPMTNFHSHHVGKSLLLCVSVSEFTGGYKRQFEQ